MAAGFEMQAYFVMSFAHVCHKCLRAARNLGVGQQNLYSGHPGMTDSVAVIYFMSVVVKSVNIPLKQLVVTTITILR